MLSNVVLLGLFAGGALAGFQKGSKVGGLSSLQPRELDYVTVVTAGTCANVPGRFSCGAPANNLQVCVTPELGESCCEEDCKGTLHLSTGGRSLANLIVQIVARQTRTVLIVVSAVISFVSCTLHVSWHISNGLH